jgi:ferredoxin
MIERNFNLCIGCTRCIRVCRDVRGIGVFDFIYDDQGLIVVGTVNRSLKESLCRLCAACVEVCPTGALMDKEPCGEEVLSKDAFSAHSDLPSRNRRPLFNKPTLAPQRKQLIECTRENLVRVPEAAGVYQLLDSQQNVIYIKGAMNLREALAEQQAMNMQVRYFVYEENPLYSTRETELLQQYLACYGEMPEINRELDDLF